MTDPTLASMSLVAWQTQDAALPQSGETLLANFDDQTIVVYQAFNPLIADEAVASQAFGAHFSLTRMSWIKPGFLWMMYRSGWADKPGQERVLAIRVRRDAFDRWLHDGVRSAFDPNVHASRAAWKEAVDRSSVRIQWDPDHHPHGNAVSRRAIQIGLRQAALAEYVMSTTEITDITTFVHDSHRHVRAGDLARLLVPEERPYPGPRGDS